MIRFCCGLFPSCGGCFHAGSSHGKKRQVWSLSLSFFFFKKLKKKNGLAMMWGVWGLRFPTRDQTYAPLLWKHRVLPTREVPLLFLIGHYIMIDLFSWWQNLITSQKPHLWILGCSKCSFRLWKNLNKCFGQPNVIKLNVRISTYEFLKNATQSITFCPWPPPSSCCFYMQNIFISSQQPPPS